MNTQPPAGHPPASHGDATMNDEMNRQQTSNLETNRRVQYLRGQLMDEGADVRAIVAALTTEGIALFEQAFGRDEAAAWLRGIADKMESGSSSLDGTNTRH